MQRPLPLLGAATFVGLSTDVLFHASASPGLNTTLFFGAVAVAVVWITRAAGRRLHPEALAWLGAGLALALTFSLRAAPPLHFAAFVAAAASFAFASYRGGAPWIARGAVSEVVEAVLATALHTLLGPLRLLLSDVTSASGDERPDDRQRVAVAPVARGLLIASPLVLVFGALFISADRIFADAVAAVVGQAAEEWAGHLAFVVVFSWLASGYLLGFLGGTRIRDHLPLAGVRPHLGSVEVGIALGAVNLLFAAFVAVQFRTLFGGAAWIESTPGLTYAEYTREGFGQLLFAALLVLPLLLAADGLHRPRTARERWLTPLLGWSLLALLGVVVASAVVRVRLYQAAYGLTESRFYGLVFLGWVAGAALWLGLTVLRGRRERFVAPTLLSLVALVAGLHFANPDAIVAKHNLSREGIEVDGAYLVTLSADAVPSLVAGVDGAPPEARCALATGLLERWHDRAPGPWHDWNASVTRARRAVDAAAPHLRQVAAGCPE